MKSIGLPELLVIVIIVFLVPFIWGKIFSKAGYSAWMGLTIIIPVVNAIVLCWFAFTAWPIHAELAKLRQNQSATKI